VVPQVITLTRTAGRYTYDRAKYLHFIMAIALIIGVVAVALMWGFNVLGLRGINFLFLVMGALALVIYVTRPVFVFTAMGLGVLVNGLQDKDITQGSIEGISVLFRVLFAILFYYTASAFLLATWSFQAAPWAFLVIACSVLILMALGAYLNLGGNGWKRVMLTIVVTYVVIIVAFAAWHTIPVEARPLQDFGKVATPAVTAPTVLLGWNDYTVPRRGADPLVVPIGFRVGCYDPEITKRVSLNKPDFGTSKFRYELVSLTDQPEVVEILVANSKDEARRIAPGC
jgi:hypothetical protein